MGVDVRRSSIRMGRANRICTGQLRSRTDEYVRRASAGETFHVVRRGQLVARIESSVSADYPAGGKAVGAEREVVIFVRVSDLRCRAGRLLDRVAAGEIVEIVVRGTAVARILRTSQPSHPERSRV